MTEIIDKECFNQTCNGTKVEVWITEGWPYGKNRIEVCKTCFSKFSAPLGE